MLKHQLCIQLCFLIKSHCFCCYCRLHLKLKYIGHSGSLEDFSCLFIVITSVQFSCSVMSDSLWCHEPQHARHPCPSPTPRAYSNPCPLSRWCHPNILSSVVPFSSCPRSFPASGSFPMSQHFVWGGQSTGASALASFLPKKSQGWSLSEWTSWISLQSNRLSRVFSNTTVQKHQLFGAQPSSQSNSHLRDHRKNHSLD